MVESLTNENKGPKLIIKCDFDNHNNLTLDYRRITDFSDYNKLRSNIFVVIEKEFIIPVIEKGIKSEPQRVLLQNNYSEFKAFLDRKIRYWLNGLFSSGQLHDVISHFNKNLIKELTNNVETYLQKENTIDVTKIIQISNNYICNANLTELVHQITNFILGSNVLKEEILGYFNEFLHYLVLY